MLASSDISVTQIAQSAAPAWSARRPSPFCARTATRSSDASPKSSVNSITGEGLKEAMAGAQVVIDLTNCRKADPPQNWFPVASTLVNEGALRALYEERQGLPLKTYRVVVIFCSWAENCYAATRASGNKPMMITVSQWRSPRTLLSWSVCRLGA
jgi:hypothetical protein